MPTLEPPPRAGPGADREGRRFLDRLERRLESLDRRVMLVEWAMYTGRAVADPASVHLARAVELTRPGLLGWARRSLENVRDPVLARRLTLLERAALEAEVEQSRAVVRLRTRLQRRLVAFRPRLGGRRVGRVAVFEAVRKSPDRRARREAHFADEPIRRALEPGVRELARTRNELARSLGYGSFPELRLGFEGLTAPRLRAWMEEATRSAGPVLRAVREEFLARSGDGGWYPWDLPYARWGAAGLPDGPFPAGPMVPRVLAALREWGLPARRLRFRVVRHDLPFGGLTVVPHVPDDVRVLVHPAGGWEHYLTLFHEFGHAVHASSVRQPTHLLRTNDPGYAGFVEGVAEVFAAVGESPEWLRRAAGVGRAAAERFRASQRVDRVLRAVGLMGAVELELALYDRPDADVARAHHRWLRRVLRFDPHPVRAFGNTFLVTHPVYTQSYFLADLFRAQVLESLRRATGARLWPNRRAGPWLARRFLEGGAAWDWIPRVREVTGRPFGPDAFRRETRAAAP